LPPDKAVFGMTYGDWSVAWWQWVLSIPASDNPLNDTSGVNCGRAQSAGPVFFLTGSFVGAVTRNQCAVPAGKVLFFPIISGECSTLEGSPFFGSNAAQLHTCAGGLGDGIDIATLKVEVDGKEVHAVPRFRAQSPVFGFTLPDTNVLDVNTSKKGHSGSSASDGFWVMLKPLKSGKHTIHFEGACLAGSPCNGFTQDVTYNIVTP